MVKKTDEQAKTMGRSKRAPDGYTCVRHAKPRHATKYETKKRTESHITHTSHNMDGRHTHTHTHLLNRPSHKSSDEKEKKQEGPSTHMQLVLGPNGD
jgi:hypothetical protein